MRIIGGLLLLLEEEDLLLLEQEDLPLLLGEEDLLLPEEEDLPLIFLFWKEEIFCWKKKIFFFQKKKKDLLTPDIPAWPISRSLKKTAAGSDCKDLGPKGFRNRRRRDRQRTWDNKAYCHW